MRCKASWGEGLQRNESTDGLAGGSSDLAGRSYLGSAALSTMPSLKEWKTSCPEASLAETITSTSFSAQSFGTFQVNFPPGVNCIPAGPDSSFNLTLPFFDFTTGV